MNFLYTRRKSDNAMRYYLDGKRVTRFQFYSVCDAKRADCSSYFTRGTPTHYRFGHSSR